MVGMIAMTRKPCFFAAFSRASCPGAAPGVPSGRRGWKSSRMYLIPASESSFMIRS